MISELNSFINNIKYTVLIAVSTVNTLLNIATDSVLHLSQACSKRAIGSDNLGIWKNFNGQTILPSKCNMEEHRISGNLCPQLKTR